jgi:polyisoprenoid-binding protein YceI
MKSFKKSAFVLASTLTAGLIAIAANATSVAAPKSIEFPAAGTVTFLAIGKPAAIKINGSGEAVKGSLAIAADNKASGVLTFNLKSLNTGIDLRDKHMKEKYLQVDQYPESQLTIKDLAIPDDVWTATAAPKDIPFTGKLKLKGTEKDVQGTAHVKKHGSNLELTAQFSIKLDDFGVDIPKYLGITVANEVKIEVSSTPIIKE